MKMTMKRMWYGCIGSYFLIFLFFHSPAVQVGLVLSVVEEWKELQVKTKKYVIVQ